MQFTDQDRLIYRYHDGAKERCADPLAVRRRLIQSAGGDLGKLADAAAVKEKSSPESDGGEEIARLDAEERLLGVIRYGFELPAFDPATGEGCTEAMLWKIWDDYWAFVEGERKPAGS